MAIKNIIASGIGFSPGSISFIPTHGFSIGEAIEIVASPPPSPQRSASFEEGNRTSGFTSLNRSTKMSSKNRTMN